MDYDRWSEQQILRELEHSSTFRKNKRDYERRGYEVDRFGDVSPKSGFGPSGYIDEDGKYHDDM